MLESDVKGKPPEAIIAIGTQKIGIISDIKDYLRYVASVDDSVGELLDFLQKTNQWDNTIVIYTSDQGFFLGDHGWYDKRLMYELSGSACHF